MDLPLAIYRNTRSFPKDELYGLTAQLRRAAVFVPSNIAEGKGRSSDKRISFCFSAMRAARSWNFKRSWRSRYLPPPQAAQLLEQAEITARTLNGLINSLKNPVAA
jgi:four helix bundle protein